MDYKKLNMDDYWGISGTLTTIMVVLFILALLTLLFLAYFYYKTPNFKKCGDKKMLREQRKWAITISSIAAVFIIGGLVCLGLNKLYFDPQKSEQMRADIENMYNIKFSDRDAKRMYEHVDGDDNAYLFKNANGDQIQIRYVIGKDGDLTLYRNNKYTKGYEEITPETDLTTDPKDPNEKTEEEIAEENAKAEAQANSSNDTTRVKVDEDGNLVADPDPDEGKSYKSKSIIVVDDDQVNIL